MKGPLKRKEVFLKRYTFFVDDRTDSILFKMENVFKDFLSFL